MDAKSVASDTSTSNNKSKMPDKFKIYFDHFKCQTDYIKIYLNLNSTLFKFCSSFTNRVEYASFANVFVGFES